MNLNNWLISFWEICLGKKGPEDLPYSPLALRNLIVIIIGLSLFLSAFLINLKINKNTSLGFLNLFLMISSIAYLPLIFIYFCLKAFKKTNRFIQMGTAALGIELLFSMMNLSLNLILLGSGTPLSGNLAENFANPLISFITLLAFILDYIWKPCVYMQIFKRGFESSQLTSALLVVLFLFQSKQLLGFLIS